MGRRVVILSIVVGALLSLSPLKAQQLELKPLNISLWEPIAYPTWDTLLVHNVSLGLLQAKNAYIYGASINLIGGRFTGDVRGVALSGLMNYTAGRISGVQASSVWNATIGDIKGVQLGGFSNMAIQNVDGVQLASIVNFSGGIVKGFQFAGLTNIAGQEMYGVQITPISNLVLGQTTGVQLGGFNFSEELLGMQIGMINLTGVSRIKKRGVQIGLINYSADSTTVQLGLINATPGIRINALLYGGTLYHGGMAIRFKKKNSYNIIGFGVPYVSEPHVYSGAILYRSGYSYAFNRLDISADAGLAYISVANENPQLTIPEDLYSVQLRLNFEYRFSKRFGLILTGGWARDSKWFEIDEYSNRAFAELGISLF